MLIDWFTVGAQVLNFLLLVWLMKRFLYKPILNAIDTREKRIAKELADADATQAAAGKERDEFQRKNEEFDQQRAALLSEATDDAKKKREKLLAEARDAADAMSAKRQESLADEARNLKQAITRRAQDEVFAIARKTLSDLASVNLEERMAEAFTHRVRELNGEAKEVFSESLNTATEPALIRSTFELPNDQRSAIRKSLNETFALDVPIRFETAPDLVCGIELSTSGQKMAWSISDYLASLEKGVGELLESENHSRGRPKPD